MTTVDRSLFLVLLSLLGTTACCGTTAREMLVEKPYWRFPIDNRWNAPKIRFDAFDADGTCLRSYSMALAKDRKGDWQPSEDVRPWMGKKVTLRIVKAPPGDTRENRLFFEQFFVVDVAAAEGKR